MNNKELTYLDYNASAPVRPSVCDVMSEALRETGNPSSVHSAGRRAYNRLTKSRRQVASLAGALPEQVIFTSGGTEANFLAIKGAVVASRATQKPASHILVGASEHPSILAAVEETGLAFDVIPVDENGVIKLESLKDLLVRAKSPCLICVMMANNETGIIQPVMEIARLAERYEAMLHVDAVQAAGKLDLATLGLGVCHAGGAPSGLVSLSISAHKIGGPQGIGAVILRDGHVIKPLFTGGGQEQGRRSGTENLPGIVGFGEAAKEAVAEISDMTPRLLRLRDRLEAGLLDACPQAVIFSSNAERLANTSCFAIPGLVAEKALISFDLEGICISSGAACSSGKVAMSHVLRAMNVSDDIARCALRVSLGWETSDQDIESFIKALRKIINRLKTGKQKNELV